MRSSLLLEKNQSSVDTLDLNQVNVDTLRFKPVKCRHARQKGLNSTKISFMYFFRQLLEPFKNNIRVFKIQGSTV